MVASDVTGVADGTTGTTGVNFGTGLAGFFYGDVGGKTNKKSLVNSSGVVASTVNGVQQNIDVPFRAFECMCAGLAYYLSKKRIGIDQATRMELKTDYEAAYQRLIAGDDTPSTRILPNKPYYGL